ncbi:MAG: respiratory nitrate reductase subunit gamma [bacterium]
MTPLVNTMLFVVLPYLVVTVGVLGSAYRFAVRPFSYSSLASQFLEGDRQFYGATSFHYGVLVLLAGHLAALLFPETLLHWNGVPLRLYLLETTGLAFAVLTAFGLGVSIFRRLSSSLLRQVTSRADWFLLALLAVQVGTGMVVALTCRWGSSWFAASLAPYLRSLVALNPNPAGVAAMPVAVRIHVVAAFLLVGVVPFSRLVHVLVVPVFYLWRRPLVFRWWRQPGNADRLSELRKEE